jgi:peptidoglycan/xylan/chitin deacetylase (PgdA/CDA1 family)
MPSSVYASRVYRFGKWLMFESLFRSGLVHRFRRGHRNSVLVLIYHDVLPPGFPEDNPLFGMTVSTTEFEWQVAYVCRHYRPINFEQFAEWFSNDAPLPPHSVLITFDDGHANNCEFALPILSKFGISAVCFVLSGNLGARKQTWFEEAYYRLMFSNASIWTLNNGEVWPLETPQQRASACGRFFTLCRSLTEFEQKIELQSLRQQLQVSASDECFRNRFEFLSPVQLQSMREVGIEIGAHTVNHPILSTLPPEEAFGEILGSKLQMEEASGTPVRAFAYPFGAPGLDFGEREMMQVRQSGFSFGFAGEGGFVDRSKNVLNLPRVGIGRMTRAQFACTITGTTDSLKARLGGMK